MLTCLAHLPTDLGDPGLSLKESIIFDIFFARSLILKILIQFHNFRHYLQYAAFKKPCEPLKHNIGNESEWIIRDPKVFQGIQSTSGWESNRGVMSVLGLHVLGGCRPCRPRRGSACFCAGPAMADQDSLTLMPSHFLIPTRADPEHLVQLLCTATQNPQYSIPGPS